MPIDTGKSVQRLVGMFHAYKEAAEAENRLAEWLEVPVNIAFEFDAELECTAVLVIDGLQVCAMTCSDPTSAIDELVCWSWGTLVIATGSCVWDWGEFAEA